MAVCGPRSVKKKLSIEISNKTFLALLHGNREAADLVGFVHCNRITTSYGKICISRKGLGSGRESKRDNETRSDAQENLAPRGSAEASLDGSPNLGPFFFFADAVPLQKENHQGIVVS